MNVNEVIANKANSLDNTLHIHPNDHVNMSQSSNDVIPTAIHLMIGELINKKLLIAIDDLINVFKKVISDKSFDIVKVGRTHLQDATPITLHQEFSAFIDMLENNKQIILESLNYIYQLPIGGTAVGTGYSSLNYLSKMAVDMLKIDKSFVDEILTKEGDKSFVDIIIKLGHLMNCKVIAEGVEDQDQLSTLAFLGCDCVQGYIWGKPIPLENLSNCL